MIIVAPSSSQGGQSKLGGPEDSLFERPSGVGREERPPIVVVVQALKTGSAIYYFLFYYLCVIE